jgi:hypothetical protein
LRWVREPPTWGSARWRAKVGTTEGEGWHGGGAPTTAESGAKQGAGPSPVTLPLLRASEAGGRGGAKTAAQEPDNGGGW